MKFINRRASLKLLGAGAATTLAAPFVINSQLRAQNSTVYVNSYGGSLQDAWQKAFFEPFTAATGIKVEPVSPVSFARLRSQVQSGVYDWDVTIINSTEINQAEAEKLTEPLNKSIVKVDALPAGLAYAALAGGAPLDKIYPMDVDAAFAKMDEIKPHIKAWWQQGGQSQQVIRDGEVSMIAMWTVRAVDLINQGVPLNIVWNQAESYAAYWIVAKGSPRAELAWQYINFVAQPEQQAALTRLVPYGPVNDNALSLVDDKIMAGTPSYPANRSVCFEHDVQWLEPRLSELKERWALWMVS